MQELIAQYNCRCTMIPLSRDDAIARGIDDNTGWKEPAPEPVQQPQQQQQPTAEPAAPPPVVVAPPPIVKAPTPKKAEPPKYRVVQKLGGSTGAEKVVDAKGKQYVRKFGASPAHVKEEFAAEEMYRAAGVAVPASRLEKQDGKPVKLSEFITARPLGVLAGEDRKKAEAAVRKHFAADALFGNWDVLGMDADNVLVTSDGTVHRVDVGGSLRFRAQGETKAFSEFPDELTTLRDPKRSAARVFKPLTNKELVEQIDDLQSRREAILAAAPKDLKPTLSKRLDNMKSIAELWRKEPDTKRQRTWEEQKALMRSARVQSKFPTVTPAQQDALQKYTANAFEPLNAALRENPDNPEFYPTGNLVNPVEVHDALQGMFKQVGDLPKELIVYRGRRNVATVDKMEEVMNKGGTITFEGYGSASFDPNIAAEKFGPVVYEIVARSGIDLASLHGYKGIKLEYGNTEAEILQHHGTKYKVVGIQRNVPGKLFGDDRHEFVHIIQMVQVE